MPNEQQWVAFRIAGQAYALPIAEVREIVRTGEITPVPQSPGHIAGVKNLRGRIIPVIDLRKRLGPTSSQPSGAECQMSGPEARNLAPDTRKARVLVLSVSGKLIGMLVDEASEVLKIAPADIDPNPNLFGDGSETYVHGIAKHQGRLVVLLEAEKLLARHES